MEVKGPIYELTTRVSSPMMAGPRTRLLMISAPFSTVTLPSSCESLST